MKTKISDIVRFAGVSIVQDLDGKSPKINYHTSVGDSRMGIWIDPPGQATFLFVKVPSGLNKIEAAQHLIDKENGFGNPAVVDYLKRKIIRMIATTPESEATQRSPHKLGQQGLLSTQMFRNKNSSQASQTNSKRRVTA